MNRDELEKRTLEFIKNLISALKKLPRDLINDKLIGQSVFLNSELLAESELL